MDTISNAKQHGGRIRRVNQIRVDKLVAYHEFRVEMLNMFRDIHLSTAKLPLALVKDNFSLNLMQPNSRF